MRLFELAKVLESFRSAVEFIQDFICSFGMKIFQEEFERLINCYVDMEYQVLVTQKLEFEELYYDEDIPMPDLVSREF